MKKLEKVYLPELLEVKMQMQKRKRAANLDGGGSYTLWSGALPDKGIG